MPGGRYSRGGYRKGSLGSVSVGGEHLSADEEPISLDEEGLAEEPDTDFPSVDSDVGGPVRVENKGGTSVPNIGTATPPRLNGEIRHAPLVPDSITENLSQRVVETQEDQVTALEQEVAGDPALTPQLEDKIVTVSSIKDEELKEQLEKEPEDEAVTGEGIRVLNDSGPVEVTEFSAEPSVTATEDEDDIEISPAE